MSASADSPVLAPNSVSGYASERWLRLVGVVLTVDADLRTVNAWGREAGVSPAALRARCRAVGVTAKRSLEFARILRIIIRHPNREQSAFEVLDVVDKRTMGRLLRTAGIESLDTVHWPSLAEYVDNQAFIRDPLLVRAVAELCDALTAEAREREPHPPQR